VAEREQARVPVAVEPPTLTALRTLLHHPQLAAKSKTPGTLRPKSRQIISC
jgi:DNA primase